MEAAVSIGCAPAFQSVALERINPLNIFLHTPWMDRKIETWDVGYYQVRNAMKDIAAVAGRPPCRKGGHAGRETLPDATGRVPPAEALRAAHDALHAKLLQQVYSLGFLNPDVVYFE